MRHDFYELVWQLFRPEAVGAIGLGCHQGENRWS